MTLTDNPIEAALKKALEVSKASPGIIPPPKSRFQQKKENLIPEFGKLTAPNEYIDPTTLNEPVDIFRQNQINREATKPEPTIKDDVFKYVDIFNDVISKVTPVDLLPDGVPGAGFVKDLAGKERRAEWFKNTLAPIIDNGLRVVKNVREGINPDEDLPGALLHTWDGVLAGTGLGLSLMPPLMLINAFTPQVAQYGGDTAEALGMPRNVGEEMGNLILLAPFGKRVIAGVLASETLSDFAENVLKDSDMTDEMKSRIVETVQHLGFFGGMYASGKTRPLEWKDGRLQVKESAVYNPKELRPVDPTPTPTVNEVPLLEPPKSSKLTKADEYLIEREPAEFDLMKNELDRAINLENPKVEGVNYQKILDLLDVDMRKLEEQVTNPGLTPQERTKALKEMEAVDKRREIIKEKIKPVKLIENINPKPQENPLAKVDVSEIPTGVKAPELLAEEQRARELERQRAELEKDNAPGQLEELNRLRDMDFELRWNGTGRNISNPDYRDLNKRVTNFQNEAERVANESIPPSDKKIIESAEKEFRKEVQDQKAGEQPIVDIKIVSEENYRKALRDLKHKINRLNMSFGLDTIPELVVIGKYHLQRIPEYKAWAKEMIKEFGERVKPYLKEIYDRIEYDGLGKENADIQSVRGMVEGVRQTPEKKDFQTMAVERDLGRHEESMLRNKHPFEKALAELKQVSRTLNSNPLDFYAKHFKNLTIVGLHYLKQGIKTLPEFTKKLTDTFGRGAKDFAVPLWNRTVSRLKEVQPKTAVNKFGDEHTPNSVNDHVNNAIKSIFQEYPELIHEMKVSPIQFRELSAKANKILQDIIEGKDSLSKYENQMTPTGLVVMRAHADYETRNALHIMDNVPMTEAGFQKGIDALNAATVAVGKANKLKSMTGQLFAANRVPIDTSQIGVKTGKVASPHEIKQGSDLVKQWEVLAKRATDFYSGKRVELHKQLKKLRKEKAPADQIRAVEDKIRFYGMQEKMYRDKLNELNKSLSTVSKSKRSKLYSAVALIRYNFLLSGIPTQMANIMGNFFNVGIEMGRLVTMGEVKPVVRSFVGEHPRESVTSMINYFLGKETLQGAKIVSAENQGFSSLSDKPSKVLKALDYTVNLPLKALGAADAAFYRFAYGLNKERQIADFQKTNKEAEPYFDSYERVKSLFERIEKEVPQDITVWEKEIINRLDEATRYAQLLTFRQPLKGQVPEGLQKISDSKIGLIVLPFVTTLINMVKMSGKYSPLPLIKLLGQEGREQYRQLSKLEKRDYNSRILIGTALTYGLAQLMANGSIVITGSLTTGLSMSANNDFRKTLQAQGIEPNQIGVKNPDGTYTTFTYTNLPVLNYILFALGAVSDQEKWGRRDEAQDVFTKVTKAGLNFISSMTQQTLLSSINYLFQAISNQNADYIYDSIISWILPSAVPQGLQSDVLSENPNVIDKSLKSPGTDFQKRLSRKLGNESDYYIPKRGIYGDVLEKSNQRFPLPPKTIGNDKVTNLLIDTQFRMNLRDLTDYKFVTQDADGTTSTIPMDKNDIDLFNQKVGQAFRIAMEDNYEDINSMSSLENKQKAVYSVLSEVADDVKKQMFLSKRNELTPESYEIYKFKKKSPINSRRAVEEVFK